MGTEQKVMYVHTRTLTTVINVHEVNRGELKNLWRLVHTWKKNADIFICPAATKNRSTLYIFVVHVLFFVIIYRLVLFLSFLLLVFVVYAIFHGLFHRYCWLFTYDCISSIDGNDRDISSCINRKTFIISQQYCRKCTYGYIFMRLLNINVSKTQSGDLYLSAFGYIFSHELSSERIKYACCISNIQGVGNRNFQPPGTLECR